MKKNNKSKKEKAEEKLLSKIFGKTRKRRLQKKKKKTEEKINNKVFDKKYYDDIIKKLNEMKHPYVGYKFEVCWCNDCTGIYIKCPRCGNNTCNGGYGEDGKCPVCPVAYDLMYLIEKNTKEKTT